MRIIVTVTASFDEKKSLDLELPVNVPILDFIPAMINIFRKDLEGDGNFVLEIKDYGQWRRLDESRSFQALGIEDGAYLCLREVEEVSAAPTPISGWNSLYSDQPSNGSDEKRNKQDSGFVWKLLD